MNHDELAKAVGISRMALTGLETEKGTSRQATEMKVVSYLEARGIEFVDGTVRIGVFLNLKDAGADERPPGAE